MSRPMVGSILMTAVLLTACSSGKNNHVKGAPVASPTATATVATTPAGSATPPSASTPARSGTVSAPGGASTSVSNGGAGLSTAATASATPARPGGATAVSASPAAAPTAPLTPPPPPPLPTGTQARGGRDSVGATLPVNGACPNGFPVRGADDQKAYLPADAEYATLKPVACFQGAEDAITAGYRLAHP